MSIPNSAREALIAEAVADILGVVDPIRHLVSDLHASTQALQVTSERVEASTNALQAQVAALVKAAHLEVMRRVHRSTGDLTRDINAAQVQAMQASARVIFDREVNAVVQRLAQERRDTVCFGVQGRRGWMLMTAALTTAWALGLGLGRWLFADG